MTFNKDKLFPQATNGARGFSNDADNAQYNALREKVLEDERVRKQSLGQTAKDESGLKKIFHKFSSGNK